MRVALKRVDAEADAEADPDAEADAEDDEEFFDPSDFDDEDAAAPQRSERAGVGFTDFCLVAAAAAIMAATWFAFAFALFFPVASTVMRAASSSALIPPSIAAMPPPLAPLFVDCALHSHDAIYLLEGDNVGR